MSETTLPTSIVQQEANRARQQKAEAPATAPGTAEPAIGITLDRQGIIHGVDTGKSVKFDKSLTPLSPLEDRSRPQKDREVTMTPELTAGYVDILASDINDLGELAKQDAPEGSGAGNKLEFVLADSKHSADKILMEMLSERVKGTSGETLIQAASRDKILAFLQTGMGWEIATAKMEQDALMMEMAGGITAKMRAIQYRKRQGKEHLDHAILDEDLRTLRSLGKTAISKSLTGLYFAGHQIVGRGKTEIDFDDDLKMLAALKDNVSAADKAYLSAVTGVDLDRIELDEDITTDTFSFAKGEDYLKNRDRALKTRITQRYALRKEFFNQLGVDEPPSLGGRLDRNKKISFPEEFIFKKDAQREGLPVHYLTEIDTEYENILKRYGSSPDKYQQLAAMAQAREKVMLRNLELQKKLIDTANEAGSLSAIRAKRQEMEANPEKFKADQETEHTDRLHEAERRRDEAKAKRTQLTEGEESFGARTQALIAKETEIVREFDIPLTEDFAGALQARLKELKETATRAYGEIQTRAGNKSAGIKAYSDEVIRKVLASRENQVIKINGKTEDTGGVTVNEAPLDPVVAPVLTAITNDFDTQIVGLQEFYKQAQADMTAFEAQVNEYKALVNQKEAATLGIAANPFGQLGASRAAYDELTGGAGGTQLIAPDKIRTTSVDELVKLLTEGTTDEKLQKALHAKVEAKAREREVGKPLPHYQKDALTAVTDGTGITPDDLFRISLGELRGRLRESGGWDDDDNATKTLLAAKQAANSQLLTRYELRLDEEIKYFDDVSISEQKKIDDLKDLTPRKNQLDAAIGIMSGQGDTFQRIDEIADDPNKLVKLAGRTPISANDTTYSQAERDSGLASGVLEWYDLLRKKIVTQTGANGEQIVTQIDRDTNFKALFAILPPDKLAALLNQSLLGSSLAEPKVEVVFARIGNLISNHELSAPRLRQATKQLINHARDHALAL